MPNISNIRRAARASIVVAAIFFIAAFNLSPAADAQRRGNARGRAQAAASNSAAPARRDPDVARMLAEIDPRNIERTVRKLVSFGTRNTLSAQDNPARGIGAARDWLKSEFEAISRGAGGRLKVELQSYTQEAMPPPRGRIPQPTVITNVVATLRGTQPASAERMYVVSGHYDSMCTSPTDATCDAPGANDDASGVAAVVEMARVMSRREFDATIVFMAVAGEEQGLLGATHYAEQAKQKNLNIEAMFTNDIVGNSLGGNGVRDPHTVRVFSEGVPSNETPEEAATRRGTGGENDSGSRQLARFIKEVGATYMPAFNVQLIYRRDRYLRGGDHIPFLERGFAAVRFCELNEDYTHQHQNVRTENGIVYGDLPEFVDYDYIARVARLNAASLATLARAPARPKAVGLLTRRLTNDTDLQWTANTEDDLAGYEVVWRETSSPVWTNAQMVGNVTTYTAKGVSKDNYFFGVRAVDRQGNRSPASAPRPVR
ncbi:MAG TPA: M28 family metallopeptidase [Pyrinomonadaceae bacterium]|nr:M28 family metallopeptidase [Pyrinomonadaceae bacterium]